MFIKIQVLLTFFATLTPTSGGPSDLCDIVYADTGRPIWCEPHRERAPVYDGTVCCDEGTCFKPHGGSCLDGEEPFHCELGEVGTNGEVSCYFEVPEFCEAFPCVPGFQAQAQANLMCCYEGTCWNIDDDSNDCEIEDIYWCDDGVTNEDGTMTCFD